MIERPYLNFVEHGEWSQSGLATCTPQQFEEDWKKIRQQVRSYSVGEPLRLLIYVHGGVTSEIDGQKQAEEIKERFASPRLLVYPVFWESGLWETIQYLNSPSLKAVMTETLIEARGRAEVAQMMPSHFEGMSDHLTDPARSSRLDRLVKQIQNDAQQDDPFAKELMSQVPKQRQHGILFVESAQILPLRQLLDQVVSEAAVALNGAAQTQEMEAFGLNWDEVRMQVIETILRAITGLGAVWNNMKERCLQTCVQDQLPGRALAEQLVKLKTQTETASRVEVILLAHSAGSYFAAHLVDAIAEERPQNHHKITFIDHLVLTAPALTYDIYAKTIHTYRALIKNIAIFILPDQIERNTTSSTSLVYPATVLYLVANVFDPQPWPSMLIGMQRVMIDAQWGRDVPDYLKNHVKAKQKIAPSQTHGHMSVHRETVAMIRRLIL